MKTTKNAYTNRYHRDGTVTYWDTYAQQWERLRASRISAQSLATMSATERARIARIAAK